MVWQLHYCGMRTLAKIGVGFMRQTLLCESLSGDGLTPKFKFDYVFVNQNTSADDKIEVLSIEFVKFFVDVV
jgi:hypothetical protein